jgi:hypothetical protein
MKRLRLALPLLALASLTAAGCLLISGQFVVHYDLPSPLHVLAGATLTGVDVDLNTVSAYNDHKKDLKRVDDLALTGRFDNNTVNPAAVEVWIVPSGAMNLSLAQVQSSGVRLWGPLNIAANGSESVDWNRSAKLFVGRQTLIDEIKGDGQFSLYVVANASFDLAVTNGSLVAVVAAAK